MTFTREDLSDDVTIYLGDCREIIPTLACIAAVITDPPYSSGGATRTDRNAPTSAKYVTTGTIISRPEFCGDNRDQRSLTLWLSDWMASCLAVSVPGSPLLCFMDWRNLTCCIDAVQVAGWVYRGIVPWDKTEASRPQKGWFRAQCEYVVTASAGALGSEQSRAGRCSPGILRASVNSDGIKEHITQKPATIIEELLLTSSGWDVVLDPFMGSGSTGIACIRTGRKFIGIEIDRANYATAKRRLLDALARPLLALDDPATAPRQEAMAL